MNLDGNLELTDSHGIAAVTEAQGGRFCLFLTSVKWK